MPTISVALATYNGERFLAAQLASLANQSVRPAEVVIADDNSSDSTLAIISEFAGQAPFEVRILQNKQRLGYRFNFLQLAEACRSDLISFCDQDDIWHYDKLHFMQEVFNDANVLLAFHNSALIAESGKAIGSVFSESSSAKTYLPLKLYPWRPIPGHTQIFRRSLCRFASLYQYSLDPYSTFEKMSHDYWFPFWASVLGNIVFIPQCLTQYRQHGTNASGWPHPSFLHYVTDHIKNAEKYAAAEFAGAENRIALLQLAKGLLQGDDILLWRDANSYYEAARDRSELRLAVYDGETFLKRLRTLGTLVMRGAYVGEPSESFGLPGLLLDAAIGVPFKWVGR